MQIVSSQRPIHVVLADPNTSVLLRDRLRLVLEIRQFAEAELHLQPNGHYLRYADLHRPFMVWNVHAAPELSLEPKNWWYPIVGRQNYHGYFSEAEAHRYARKLEHEGYDVFVGGVEAYSTLGWFRDPVVNTFVFDDETELAELLFHELAHQRVFARGDTDFNEAFATAVAEEGLRRWIQARNDASAFEKVRADRERQKEFLRLVSQAREKLREIYGETDQFECAPKAPPKLQLSAAAKTIAKARLFGELRRDYELLKAEWGGYDQYDDWFGKSLNNAKLNTVETYYKLVPAFHELLRVQGGDLRNFYREAKALSALAKIKRHRKLTELLDNVVTGDLRLQRSLNDGAAAP
jgi:predicted aminopeptidase